MSFFTHEFEGHVERHGNGRAIYHIVYLPEDVAVSLPFAEHPRLRVSAELNDFPIEGAFVPHGDGRWHLHIGKRVLKATELQFGDRISVRFAIADQDAVDIPQILQAALDDNPTFASLWSELTPGKQRGYSYRIGQAKRLETQEKRILELFDELYG